MKLDANALSHLRVKDLQRELKKRELDTSGLKATLLQRLEAHLQQEQEKETKKRKEECRQANSDKEKEVESSAKVMKNKDKEEDDDKNNRKEKSAELREKRGTDAIDNEEDTPSEKKVKLTAAIESISSQPEDESTKMPTPASKSLDNAGDTEATHEDHRTTLRIDNFIRPFTLNAVKTLVQEMGNFVENGFWMDAIKTHCFVTFPTSEIAIQTSKALNGKVWPPENGRSLLVTFVDHTAMEVSQSGEANLPRQPKTRNSDAPPSTQRQKEEVKERMQRLSQQPEDQPRKRRHRGGRKRNRRARFQR